MGSARRTGLACLVAGLVLGVCPAPLASAAEQQPSDQQIAAALARAEALRVGEERQAASVAEATAAVQSAAADSSVALEAYRTAAETRREAVVELTRRQADLAEADHVVARSRADLTRWARDAYVDGGSLGLSPTVYTLLAGGSTDDVDTHRAWLQRAGRSRSELTNRLQVAADQREQVAADAERAAVAAEATAASAAAASAARDAVLAAQRRRLAELQDLLTSTRQARASAEEAAADLAAAQLAAGSSLGGGANRVTGPVGDCPGGDVSSYGNGRIPLSALCPLTGTTGGLLRADAAYAFNRLSAAYAQRFGRAMCVSDSYRSYDDQVRVRAARPGLAAVPGRSNHGWGTAVDLCGGVERFDSGEHAWLRVNGPLFGWFHPAWAQRSGTLPEAWHWEFAG